VLVLGQREPDGWHFSEPRLLTELAAAAKTDNPSVSSDLLELYFTSERTGNADIYVAERSSADASFAAPKRIDALSTTATETSTVLTHDGLTLYWASDREGGAGDLDIWRAHRSARGEPWGTAENVRALSTSRKDLPRLPGLHDAVMPLSSDRHNPGYYAIWFARVRDDSGEYSDPQRVTELTFDGESTVDGFLTDDGLTLFYVTGPSFGWADMFVASRRSTDDAFEHFEPLAELNTESDERDPWLSADGRRFFFSSNRGGQYAIYEASVERAQLAD
jgi:Tol biopolymer transport system component